MLTLLCCCTGAWAQSTSDVLNGVFTVSNSGKRVQFSKGNLQYVNDTYQFAEHQYDYSGNYQDWFAFNSYSAPSDGISWYVLSRDEWEYLFVSRSVTNTLSEDMRYSKATIDGTYKGVIVFPDNYTHPNGTDFVGNSNNATEAYTSTVSLEGWALMEAAGCVFLPAAGYSTKPDQINKAAVYQSTTPESSNNCYTPGFYNDKIAMEDVSRRTTGVPVRYVKQYELPQDADGYYLLSSVQDWKDFAAIVNNGTNTAANAKMTADIDLGDDQTMIGSESTPYQGLFDGQGHTLTVNWTTTGNYCAPFPYINGATFKNLHVTGTINTSHRFTGGLVGQSKGTSYINNCRSNVEMISSYNGDAVRGGFAARVDDGGTLNFNDCVFDGTFTGPSSQTWGGFVGWIYSGSVNIVNGLFVPKSVNVSATYSATFSGNGGTVTNSYYTVQINNSNQGTQTTTEHLADGTTTANLQAGRSEVVWVQDPVTNQSMLAIFANAVTLTDGDNLSALSAYAGKACKVAYSRSFTEGKSSTVCLPFAFAKGSVGKFYTFTGITHEGSNYEATMTEYTDANLEPNTPYLFTPSATGSVDFGGTYTLPASITAGSTVSGDWTYLGTYETISWTEAPTGIYGFSAQAVEEQGISQGEFVKVGAYVRIKPMRCYLKYKNGSANYVGAPGMNRAAGEELPETIKVRLISANGEVTAIGTLQTTTGEVTFDKDAWYSLDGRRIEGKPSKKGIYVNNGHKVIIK
jgi:hypothetical protein